MIKKHKKERNTFKTKQKIYDFRSKIYCLLYKLVIPIRWLKLKKSESLSRLFQGFHTIASLTSTKFPWKSCSSHLPFSLFFWYLLYLFWNMKIVDTWGNIEANFKLTIYQSWNLTTQSKCNITSNLLSKLTNLKKFCRPFHDSFERELVFCRLTLYIRVRVSLWRVLEPRQIAGAVQKGPYLS